MAANSTWTFKLTITFLENQNQYFCFMSWFIVIPLGSFYGGSNSKIPKIKILSTVFWNYVDSEYSWIIQTKEIIKNFEFGVPIDIKVFGLFPPNNVVSKHSQWHFYFWCFGTTWTPLRELQILLIISLSTLGTISKKKCEVRDSFATNKRPCKHLKISYPSIKLTTRII